MSHVNSVLRVYPLWDCLNWLMTYCVINEKSVIVLHSLSSPYGIQPVVHSETVLDFAQEY